VQLEKDTVCKTAIQNTQHLLQELCSSSLCFPMWYY